MLTLTLNRTIILTSNPYASIVQHPDMIVIQCQ